MGEAVSRKKAFLSKNRLCCYCGGASPSETIDHAPPKVLFLGKQRPSGLEFPCCKRCNKTHSSFDDFFSMLVQIQCGALGKEDLLVDTGRLHAIKKRFPNGYKELSEGGQHQFLDYFGAITEVVVVPMRSNDINFTASYFTARMVAAIWYEEHGVPLATGSLICAKWASNMKLLMEGVPPEILELAINEGSLTQGRFSSIGQFEYRWQTAGEIGLYTFSFHDACVSYGFLFGMREHSDNDKTDYYFRVEKNGLRPVGKPWPEHVWEGKEAA